MGPWRLLFIRKPSTVELFQLGQESKDQGLWGWGGVVVVLGLKPEADAPEFVPARVSGFTQFLLIFKVRQLR